MNMILHGIVNADLRLDSGAQQEADLMFAQHVLGVLTPKGIGATVMPHGVLFRGGEERKIRQGIIEADRLEAVIGLAPNLFYGTGIPACVLVLRGTAQRDESKRGKVLFINADRDYTAGRAQNYLDPQHVEKIVSAFEDYADIRGFARVVEVEELRENDNYARLRGTTRSTASHRAGSLAAMIRGRASAAERR